MAKLIQRNEFKNFKINEINRIKVNLASASTIKYWSSRTTITNYKIEYSNRTKDYTLVTSLFGEITTPEITFPQKSIERFTEKGLFSEEVFGPINSFRCYCEGGQTAVFNECLTCKITCTFSKIREYRFGYIPLAFPVFNSLIFLGSSNIIKILLGFVKESFIDFIYFTFPFKSYCKLMEKAEKAFNIQQDSYNFIDTEQTAIYSRQKMVKKSQRELDEVFVNFSKYLKKHLNFINKTSNNIKTQYNFFNETFYDFLDSFDLKKEIRFIVSTLFKGNYNTKYSNLSSKRLRLMENFHRTNNTLSSLMFKAIPVIPPHYRAIEDGDEDVDGSQSSAFNRIYQYILQINDKLNKIINSNLSNKEYLLITEVRALQEAVDFLVDHNKIKKKNLINERPSKSFADIIKGKTGRFRKNILGKRINFSARSVIVVNPLLRINQCGLPINILINLFTPKINVILDKLKIPCDFKVNEYLYFNILKKIIKNEVVLLNRAPTLHKLGLQTFNIVLTNSDAIQLHPLVCAAYNADFDGDQMAVYLPLTKLSYIEYNSMLKATKELFLFGNSNLKMKPSQELILGLNYLSVGNEFIKNFSFGNYFHSYDDFFSCLMYKHINIHSVVWIKKETPELEKNNSHINTKVNYIRSTAGRVLLNKIFSKIV